MEMRGAIVDGWDTFDPYNLLGVKPAAMTPREGGAGATTAGVDRSTSGGLLDLDADRPWHPDSPLFWFGLVAAATLGLVAASTSVRLGPLSASVSAGKTKQ